MKLILLPGMDGTGILFKSFASALGYGVEPIIVSYPNEVELTYAELEEHVFKLLPEGEEYVILGESFSGPIAISLAVRAPKGLRGIVLSCSFAKSPRPLLTLFGQYLSIAMVPNFVRNTMLLGSKASRSLISQLNDALTRVPGKVLSQRLNQVHNCNLENTLEQITVPVLYLKASRDRLIPVDTAEQVICFVKKGQIIELDGPHMLLQENSESAARVVASFIEELKC